MPKRVFVVHGWDGHRQEGWFPWLKKELETRGFEVLVPPMPDSAEPKIEPWITHLAKLAGPVDENTFFVGHSIGCQAVLRFLQSVPSGQRAGGVVCVAGWLTRLTGDLSDEELEIARPWLETPIDYDKVRNSVGGMVAIFSDNDEWVRLGDENQHLFEQKLSAKVIVEHNKGHFNDESGVSELPSVLEAVLDLAND